MIETVRAALINPSYRSVHGISMSLENPWRLAMLICAAKSREGLIVRRISRDGDFLLIPTLGHPGGYFFIHAPAEDAHVIYRGTALVVGLNEDRELFTDLTMTLDELRTRVEWKSQREALHARSGTGGRRHA